VDTEINAGGTARTCDYFGNQTPNESKKPRFPFRVRFYPNTLLSQPLLDQSDQSARYDFVTPADRNTFSISPELLK
jgi:hypothetical protein